MAPYHLLLSFILAVKSYQVVWSYDPSIYLCSICINSVDALRSADFTAAVGGNSLYDGCVHRFSKTACDLFFTEGDALSNAKLSTSNSQSSRDVCMDLNICPREEAWMTFAPADSSPYDIRVSKALGTRGYNKVRISVISNSTIKSDIFDYSSAFQYKWTSRFLNTGIVEVTPDTKTKIDIDADHSVYVTIPSQGSGVRGVILADPCFQSQWIKCAYQDKFQMFNHTVELLNAINAHSDVSFWQILGDNFYDQTGDPTSTFFQALSQETKSKVFATVPGNHDYWVHGAPFLHVPNDQLGNGFMQFYGQDVIASKEKSSLPFDFSVNPDDSSITKSALPAASNFMFYNQVGNLGFIGYSGAYAYEDQVNYFTEACSWAAQSDSIDILLLLGHWNSDGDGCEADVTVPELYTELLALPACQQVASKMRYFMGHKHCNQVTLADIGFMVGAQGMKDASCNGQFGIPVVDTMNGKFNVYYFPIAEVDSFDNYDEILSCFKAKGVSGCYDLATLWSSTPLPSST
jgi:hypothetical protein